MRPVSAHDEPCTHAGAPSRAMAGVTSAMAVLTLYSKPECHLCVDARRALLALQADLRFELREVDISTDEALHRAYFERIPVVSLGAEELFEYFVDEAILRERLGSIL
jgi:glutaredoxin